ncbi:MAG TPA: cbb3-type cytochrome c oxidase subunit I [Burkholderiales bacterium]|nr:cbb3-type cytochrome c oxidase subunit I [Burkholderiales bacterium]
MHVPGFALNLPSDKRLSLARGWLWLGLLALLFAGVFALLLVLARTPGFQNIVPWEQFFHTALVVHVDLSVLVWFIAFGGVLWTLGMGSRLTCSGWAALAIASIGTALMALAPFVGEGRPLINNYVPVLQQPLFLFGLGLFGVGTLLLVLRTIAAAFPLNQRGGGAVTLHFGLLAAALTVVIAALALLLSYLGLPEAASGRAFYELLFWGPGHILQFTYTLLMLVAWLWLASVSGVIVALSARVVFFLFAVTLLSVLIAPFVYIGVEVASAQHVAFFTAHMQYAGGLAAVPLALVLLYGLGRSLPGTSTARAQRAALFSSIVLFSVGGFIGFMIHGANVTIPAHYHGSIVGVTLAFMGLTYYLLPMLGYAEPSSKWAIAQPLIYGGGQLLHILGLAWSGGYGVQRKVAGAEQVLEGAERKLAMGLMGAGGLIAIVGGLIFIVIVFLAIHRAKRDRRARTRLG